MSRARRLLDLLQILRRHQYPVAGAALASELGISLRTLYRDIGTLQNQGANIEGEAGLGYLLRPGFLLPPLMFEEEEIEAIVLGSQWVARRSEDARLSKAANNALTKIAAVLPPQLRAYLESPSVAAGPGSAATGAVDLGTVRDAIRNERRVHMRYRDLKQQISERVVWPLSLAFFDQVRILVAWCEQRAAFRHFRADGIETFSVLADRYPLRRRALLKEWRETRATADRN